MKKEELRIGNLLLSEDDYIISIDEIYREIILGKPLYRISGHAIVRDYSCNYPIETYQPIPLTEEWLKKLGFFKYNSAWVLQKPKRNSIDFEFSIWESLQYNTGELQPPLQFVHQLQNLYYALAGKELELKVQSA